MDQITEAPKRSIAADFLHNVKTIFDLANPLKGREKIGVNATALDFDPVRRRLLQHLGILGITLVAPILFKDLEKSTRPQGKTILEESPPPLVLETVKVSNPLEERLFKNFSSDEKAQAEKEIAEQIKTYLDQLGHERKSARVLDWESTTIKPILDLDVPPQNHQFWSEFMSAIAYIESGGRASTTSEVEIVGIAQISQATAEVTAKKHGILTFDLKKGWDSLRLSRLHFQDLMERFSTDISLLGYYAGQPFTDQKLLDALKEKGVNKEDSIMKKGISSDQQARSYIDYFGVNIENLNSEDGKEYFKKFVAALRILKEARLAS